MSVVDAVQRDLADIRERDEHLADSTLAALALALAQEIDAKGNSATSKSMNAHQLRDTIVKLRELAPPAKVKDQVAALRDARASRRATPTDRSRSKVREDHGA